MGLQRDPDCTATLAEGGLIGRPGQHARLELLMRPETFDKMAVKLQELALQ